MKRAVAEKRIPYAKLGRYVMFRVEDLDAYIEASMVFPPNHRRKAAASR